MRKNGRGCEDAMQIEYVVRTPPEGIDPCEDPITKVGMKGAWCMLYRVVDGEELVPLEPVQVHNPFATFARGNQLVAAIYDPFGGWLLRRVSM